MLQITETNYTTNLHLQRHLYQHNKCKLPCTQKIPKRKSVVLCNTTNFRDNKTCKLPCTNYRNHKNFYYKKTTQQIPANRKFPIHSSIQMLYPAKTAKKSHSAKSKITYLTQQKNPIVPFRCYSNTKVFLILPKTT